MTWAAAIGLALLFGSTFTTTNLTINWPPSIRATWYAACALGVVLYTSLQEPGLGLLLAVVWGQWRDTRDIPQVMAFGSLVGWYLLVQHEAATFEAWLPVVLTVLCALQWPMIARVMWPQFRRAGTMPGGQLREWARGTMGNRVFVGALAALALPLAPWPLVLVPAATVLLSCAWTGMVAGAVGVVIVYGPGMAGWEWTVVSLVGLVWLVVMKTLLRDSPMDSMRQRFTVWRVALQWWWRAPRQNWWFGFGYDGWSRESQWWYVHKTSPEHFHQAHNDLIQHLLEWGLCGVLAVALWMGRLGLHTAWGDPMTGALVAAILTALIQFPCRVPSIGIPMLTVAAVVGAR